MSASTEVLTPARSWPQPAAVAALLKPITWFPPMWAFVCGTISAGRPAAGHWVQILLGVALAGPLVCATSQAANDWYDRHVDAINEPNRPIPSGRIPGAWGFYIAVGWTLLSLAVAAYLGRVCFGAAVIGLVLAWVYSAPPLRLKGNGWWGNAACGACYEGLPWVTGAAILQGHMPQASILTAAALYAIGAHGIMTLNDFKSVEGDTAMGIRSLPVQLGIKRAAVIACVAMAVPQGYMMVLLSAWGLPIYAAAVGGVLLAQVVCMRKMLQDPKALAPWYNGTGITLYVAGMMVTAFALRT
jgi:chlorophyll synthase